MPSMASLWGRRRWPGRDAGANQLHRGAFVSALAAVTVCLLLHSFKVTGETAAVQAPPSDGIKWIPGIQEKVPGISPRRSYAGPAFRRGAGLVEQGKRLVDPEMPALEDRVILVTGATRGHGFQTAARLADSGCTVLVHGKNEMALNRILHDFSDSFQTDKLDGFEADLLEMEDVQELARLIAERHPKIHGILHCAANIDGSFTGRRKYSFNFHAEHTMAINALAPFYLTSLLMPQLQAAGNARVMFPTSSTMGGADYLDDLKCERYWTGLHAYRLSKLCLEMVAKEMHLRYGNAPNLTFHSFNPGSANTKLMRQGHAIIGGKKMRKAKSQHLRGEREVSFLAPVRTQKAAYFAMVDDKFQRESGHFVSEGAGSPETKKAVQDDEARAKLWEDFLDFTGAVWPEPRVATAEAGA
mmetsp:Transcript_23474/g.44223  ORF Transcript_23474/g.44223 Transcript_23474/m.44223 type:complete len:414 (+) Transcript_23474:37-1278(+)